MKKTEIRRTQKTLIVKDYACRRYECNVFETPWGERVEHFGKLYSVDKDGYMYGGFEYKNERFSASV